MNDDVDDHEEMRSEEEGKRGRFSERERERNGKTAFHIYIVLVDSPFLFSLGNILFFMLLKKIFSSLYFACANKYTKV